MTRATAPKKVRPVLLLEINEVPWRVVDHFVDRLPHLAEFFAAAKTFTTRCTDEGELSPWVTWPSFHRGMPNTEHRVRFLGQDPGSFAGTPIWEEYRRQGYTVGIAGSLQSWPPADPGSGGFFIPDTFSRDERCIPRWVEPLQKFNLEQTRSNGRVINAGSLRLKDNLRLAARLPTMGIQLRTLLSVSGQLAGEKLNPDRVARRPVFQGILYWDVFKKLFRPEAPPAFSTFFTNHVASVMHRYWHHVFPGDFGELYREQPRPHARTMLFAMEALDRMIGDALGFQRRNPELVLVFATSMGQAAKIWKGFKGLAFSIPHVSRLCSVIGLAPGEFTPLLAMVPQVCVEIPDAGRRDFSKKELEAARTLSGKPLFVVEELQSRLSISIRSPQDESGKAEFFELRKKKIPWAEAGIRIDRVDNGTAYHVPEGILAFAGEKIVPSDERSVIDLDRAKPLILEMAGL